MTPDDLAAIAQQLAGRVRDDDPDANARWLDAVCPDPADRYALLFVLAAAVPADLPGSVLFGWIGREPDAVGSHRELRPHGTAAAISRHLTAREGLCTLCRAAERDRLAKRRASSTGPSTGEAA